MPKALHLSPMVPSTHTDATVDFFCQALGFQVELHSGGYAILVRDGAMVHLQPAGEGIGEMSIYLEVDDVEGIWAGMKDHVEGLRHKPPFDRDYGMREIHVIVPHTSCLLFIGQAISRRS